MSSRLTLFLIFLLAIFTRLYGLNWGNDYFFHPDENNMATALSQLSLHNLDPHFFAYGQFPLYLGFALNLLKTPTFSEAIFILRTISAVSSVISLFLIYKISSFLHSPFQTKVSTLIAIFTPGLIQLAHFGTTESILIMFLLLQIYFALMFNRKRKPVYIYLAGIFLGLSLGTKISSLLFCLPIIFCLLKNQNVLLLIKYLLLGYIFLLFSSPYNLIKYPEFLSSMKYETGVARGTIPVFYTQQFKHSLIYLFPVFKIFPFAWGLFGFILFLLSLKFVTRDKKYLLLIFLPCLIYFLYFGQLYTKWFRFSSPIFILPSLAIPYLFKSTKKFSHLLLGLVCLPGVIFFTRYFQTDPRVQFTDWANKNIPKESLVFSEGGNVVNLPLTPQNIHVTNYDFYQPESEQKSQDLVNALLTANYVIVPSRRVYSNYNNPDFPSIQKYYRELFSEKKFKLIKTFSPFPYWLFFNQAEETFTVFDNPTIQIYKRL